MRIPAVSPSFPGKKLPAMRRYQLTLMFAVAAVSFTSLYVLAASQAMVAAIFIALLAVVLIVDNRVQRSRSRDRAIIGEQLAARKRAEAELERRAAALEEARKELAAFKQSAIAATATPDGFSRALIDDYEDHLADGLSDGLKDHLTEPFATPNALEATAALAPTAEPVGLACRDWMPVLRKNYLQGFIKNGGATVKFAIPREASDHKLLFQELEQAATEEDFTYISVDAAVTRVHLVDQIFHAVAKRIPWDELAYNFLCKTLMDSSYLVPADPEDFGLAKIAELNGLDVGQMRAIINNRLRENLYRDHEMAEDFRVAMLKLCQAQLDPQDLGVGTPEAVREWLRGELQLISVLRSASIFEKIGRHNGREMLSSLSYWLHLAGRAGLVLHLDISRFLVDRRIGESDGSVYYSTAAVADGYEVLRQFIDSTNELQYCLIVVSAPPSFLTDENRGVLKYDALYLRVWDEVHDRRRVNPLSSLIRIAETPNAESNSPVPQPIAAESR